MLFELCWSILCSQQSASWVLPSTYHIDSTYHSDYSFYLDVIEFLIIVRKIYADSIYPHNASGRQNAETVRCIEYYDQLPFAYYRNCRQLAIKQRCKCQHGIIFRWSKLYLMVVVTVKLQRI